MASTLNALSTGGGGLVSSGDASGVLQLQNNSSTTMTLDTSGNVGIGTASPSYKVEMAVSSGSNFYSATTSAVGQDIGYRLTSTATGGREYRISTSDPTRGTLGNSLAFVDQTAGAARMLIDSSGNLLVGTTALPSSSLSGIAIRNPLVAYSIWSAGSTTSQIYQIGFINGNGLVGRIETNGTATNFVTSSDERLKTNIVDAPSALSSVGSIKVRSFDWVGDGKHQEFGLVAQEINTVAPEAVSQGLEEADMWGVDFGKLVPRLVKAIQELKAINDTQAETINALTARVVALEAK